MGVRLTIHFGKKLPGRAASEKSRTLRAEASIQSSFSHEATPIVRSSIAQNSFLASGMQWIALLVSVGASLSLVGWVMLRCRSGFEFTDEGFYLNWISNPWDYHASVTQFGFVYHPLYKLVGGDIALLRQANVLILFALGWALCAALVQSVFVGGDSTAASQRAAAGVAGLAPGASSLSFLSLWG